MDQPNDLLLSNIPANCPEDYVRQWVEARGYRVFKLKLVRDLVTGTSPSFAYVQLMDTAKLDEAARSLTEQKIENNTVRVQRVVPLSSVVLHGPWIKVAS